MVGIEQRIRHLYEPTPAPFHGRITETLYALDEKAPLKRRLPRWSIVLAASVILLCGTAFALERLGVLFFEGLIWNGPTPRQVNVIYPLSQSCDSELLDVEVRDAYWENGRLSVCFRVQAKNEAAYAFLMVTDRGQDGESFDMIWWDGQIIPYEEWLPKDKKAIVMDLPGVSINGEEYLRSAYWVQEGSGELLWVRVDLKDDVPSGQVDVLISLDSKVEGTGQTEQAALSITLPPLK